jgi:hypothetical protein
MCGASDRRKLRGMNKRTVKRAAGAGVSAAFAIGTLAALAPTPALAAASPDVIVAKAPGANTFVVGISGAGGLGATISFHDVGSLVELDSNVPILNFYAPECVISGNTERCPNVTDISVSGSANADNISFNTAGHNTVVHAGAGADIMHGSAAEHDEFHADKGGDTMYVEDGDLAGCGLGDDGTIDNQVDTVYYNGTPTYKNCNFSGPGVRDVKQFSNKA